MMKGIGLCLLLLLLLPGCSPDDPGMEFTLPAETREGQNTIGFLRNGNVWVNYGRHCTPAGGCRGSLQSILRSYPYREGRTLYLQALQVYQRDKKHAVFQTLTIKLDSIKGPGVYLVDGTPFNNTLYFKDAMQEDLDYYQVDSTKTPFTVHITTIDTVANIVAGRFEGILYGYSNRKDSIIITEGRFDVKADN